MEFLLEMLFTAFVAVLFSFLVAKLVSVVMAGDSRSDSDSSFRTDVDDPMIMEELLYHQKLRAQSSESRKKVELVEQTVEKVDRFQKEMAPAIEFEQPVIQSTEVEGGKQELARGTGEEDEAKDVSRADITEDERVERREGRSGEYTNESMECVEVQESGENDDEVGAGESPEVRVSECEKKGQSQEKVKELDIEDDDWEGIERSELEKSFVAAAKFLKESGDRHEIGSAVKMELYGLHKIATEGSCREAPPMALMVSARAKWNAWQKLGNLNPDEAMERYITILSKEAPGWMGDGSGTENVERNAPKALPTESGSHPEATLHMND